MGNVPPPAETGISTHQQKTLASIQRFTDSRNALTRRIDEINAQVRGLMEQGRRGEAENLLRDRNKIQSQRDRLTSMLGILQQQQDSIVSTSQVADTLSLVQDGVSVQQEQNRKIGGNTGAARVLIQAGREVQSSESVFEQLSQGLGLPQDVISDTAISQELDQLMLETQLPIAPSTVPAGAPLLETNTTHATRDPILEDLFT